MVNKRVTLYLGCPGKAPDVYVSQFDTAWRFIFGIEYEGTEWEIPGGSVAMMNGIKPDGNVFSFAGTVSGNSVIVDCDIQMTVVAGKTICELSIIADNRVIATANFRLCVEEAPKSPSDISSESTIPAYGEILDELSNLGANTETVPDISSLLNSTKDTVLVENNDGDWGSGIRCLYEKHNEWTASGYVRANGDRMYPVPAMSAPVKHFSSYNWFQVALTWFNRSNLVHDDHNSNGLFAENCVPVDGKYDFDCSEFVSAVLLGITYDHSRYVLGSDAVNTPMNYIAYSSFPASASPDRVNGGLLANELARMFAEQGLLYRVPEDNIAEMLQPGDILFWKDSTETNHTYLHISHVGIVIETIRNYVVVMDSGVDQTSYGYDTPVATRKINVTNVHSQCPVFARPNYHTPVMPQSVRDYLKKGKLTCLSVIGASVRTSESADGLLQGEVNSQSHLRLAATKVFIPVEPGERITYTGATSLGRGAFYCNVAKYDEAFNFLGRDNICTGGVAGSIVIQPGTAYIRFYYGFSSGDYILTIPDIENNVSVKIGRDEIPPGGSTGQILAKTSGSNFDVGWVNMPTTEMQMETITSATPTITLADNTWYQCGELTSLTVSISDVSVRYTRHVIVFTSGATPTTTSFPATILGLESFTAEANTVYEINVVDNRAVVGSWAVSASS